MLVRAERELLAPREDVWSFVAEPYHLSDWWPGVAGVEPDRHGLAAGARWRIRAGTRPGGGPLNAFVRKPEATGLLLVLDVQPSRLVRLRFVDERLDAELRLDAVSPERTRAELSVEGSWLRVSRSLPRRALARLHDLVQTAATL